MEKEISGVVETGISLISAWGLQVIGAIAVFIIGRVAAKMSRRGAERALERARTDATLIPFLSGLVYYLVLAVVLIAVLSLFGIETTSLVAVLGAAGLAIGLAMQGTLSNFAAGVMILGFRPFKKGDFIDAAGAKGTVNEVGIFTTVLNTPDNVKVIVPNSKLYGDTITNFSANDTRRIDLVMGVSYGDNLKTAQEAIMNVLTSEERVLKDPAPVVAVSELGASSVDFIVRPWCKSSDYWALRWDLTRKLKEEIEAAGCSIPFPQRDVHLHQVANQA